MGPKSKSLNDLALPLRLNILYLRGRRNVDGTAKAADSYVTRRKIVSRGRNTIHSPFRSCVRVESRSSRWERCLARRSRRLTYFTAGGATISDYHPGSSRGGEKLRGRLKFQEPGQELTGDEFGGAEAAVETNGPARAASSCRERL